MQVQVARLGKPHGIRGEVTAQVLTDDPDARFVAGAEFATRPARAGGLVVRSARWNKDILLLGFEGVLTRNDAELLRGTTLFIDAEEDTDDDGWYEHDLLGLEVRVGSETVGKVTGLRTLPVQDLLIVEDANGEEVLVPFVEEIVPEVDTEAGYVRLTPPPGLFELNRGEPGADAAEGER
ncbi:ribosome maturation factor RimM [Specibacter cremeus]|uniref:ribosome maturation factor RimM n=1 Tax=Specibacter cremeus TaxID=1629051 RepID=UPI000F78AFDD|nr:ribosome maturation factor RimM [Specibacter cremeus]